MSRKKILRLALNEPQRKSAQDNALDLRCPFELGIPSDPVLAVYPSDPRVQIFSKQSLKNASNTCPMLFLNDMNHVLDSVTTWKEKRLIKKRRFDYAKELIKFRELISSLLNKILGELESDNERILFIEILNMKGEVPEAIRHKPEIPKLKALLDSLKEIKKYKFPYNALAYCLELRVCALKKMPIHWTDTLSSKTKAQKFLQLAIVLLNITEIDTQDNDVQNFLLDKKNSGYLKKANKTLSLYKNDPQSFHFTEKEQLFLNQMGMQELLFALNADKYLQLPTKHLFKIKNNDKSAQPAIKPSPIKSKLWKEKNNIVNSINVLKSYNKYCFFRKHVKEVNDTIQELIHLESQSNLRHIPEEQEKQALEKRLNNLYELIKSKANYNPQGALVKKLKIIAANADLQHIFDASVPSYEPR